MSESEFVRAFDHPFLVVGPAVSQMVELGFFTQQADSEAEYPTPDGDDEIIPLVKGGVNPYAEKLIIGRARNCDVVLRNASVSKVHAEIEVTGANAGEIVDRGSRNGTYVEEERLDPGSKFRVRSGDVLRFGGVGCAFVGAAELLNLL